ncbi:MAG: hypothetical protein M1829_000028 [Trizodia sp. TS-e1964]|nr:MAG: hypothetical protein M1829_000028 [Trizodia sp. TS-e1964]
MHPLAVSPLTIRQTIRSSALASPSISSIRAQKPLAQQAQRAQTKPKSFRPSPALQPDSWFTSSSPNGQHGLPPADERTVKLGKTLSILQDRLPTLLATPLPSEILSPNITLHLFPSTHPHLPKVSGRVAYTAALWTAPVAWGRVPLLGNVLLEILSSRIIHRYNANIARPPSSPPAAEIEKLLVRWRTCSKTKAKNSAKGRGEKATDSAQIKGQQLDAHSQFCGLFEFEFDAQGRIARHVIEQMHEAEGGAWDTAGVVSLADWLLGLAKRGVRGGSAEGALSPAAVSMSQEGEESGKS